MAEQKSGLSLQETVSFVKSRQHHISSSKHKSTQEEVMESREEDEDELSIDISDQEEDIEIEADSARVLYSVKCIGDFNAQEDGDLSFKAGEILQVLESSKDDGWLMAENALGEKGLIPGNFVKKDFEELSGTTTPLNRSGKNLWAKLRTSVKQTTLADVLSALGAVPAGFRESTLAKLLNDTEMYHTSYWLFPKASPTGMAFCDLTWNHETDRIQPRRATICREVKILTAKMIPTPGKGIQVLSRQLYLSLFNKNEILSNVHRVQVVWNPREEKTWKFLSKTQSAANSLFYSHCVIQINSTDPNIELLCELSITFKREKTGEVGELSCGWCSLPLYESTGRQAMHKTYELKLHGGTPHETGIEVDPATNISVSGSRLPPILRRNQTPRLYVQLVNSSRNFKTDCSYLPSTMVTCKLYVKMMGCFRQLVGESFLKGRLGQQLQSSVCKPALNVLLKAANQPDVMDAMLVLWKRSIQGIRQPDKTSLKFQSVCLEKIVLSHIYPLLMSTSFIPAVWSDEQTLKKRDQMIQAMLQQQGLCSILEHEAHPSPLTTKEQIFSIYP